MKICITAQGEDLESWFEPHFATAPYFIFYNTLSGQTEAIRNGYIVNDTKIGQNVVKLLSSHRIRAVITGTPGENARNLLRGSGIALHVWQSEGTVREVVTAVLTDRIRESHRRTESGTARKSS